MKKIGCILVFLSILFSGCGGGGGGGGSAPVTQNPTPEVNARTFTVVDPYVENSTFFWDKNKDGIRTSDEPLSNPSDENGTFTFDSSVDIPTGEKLVMYDKGEHNGVSYTGQLEAIITDSNVISPLTTLASKYNTSNATSLLQNAGVTIDSTDIDKDPMTTKDPQHIVASLSTDTFLKLYSYSNIDKSLLNLSDIVTLVKYLVLQDNSDENIQNSVSILDYLTNKIKTDGNFDELNKLLTDNDYRNGALNKLKNRADKSKPGVLKYVKDDWASEDPKIDSNFLDNIVGSFTQYPRKDEQTTYSLDLTSFPANSTVTWYVGVEPSSSNLSLSVSTDKKSITFTPSVAGDYELYVKVSDSQNISEKPILFKVKEVYPINMSKVDGITSDTNLSEHVGIVTNQTWIASNSLDETDLTTIISKKKTLTKIGYDKTSGVLVEYDENDTTTIEDIEELKYEHGIDDVYNRVYLGTNAIKPTVVYPNDNGAFDDGGDNWHLEVINMPEAWEYSKGSDDFLIGVIDSGFDNLHSDMQGRFATFLTGDKGDHGMGVTGAIAANTNNGFGISGVNWNTDIVASGLHYTSDIENVIDTKISGKETKLLSNSWGLGYIPSNFNPTNSSMATARFEEVQSKLAWIRRIVDARTDKLFLWAAGNGVGNGASSSGYYGVDAKYDNGGMVYKNGALSKLDNLLLVSAVVKHNGENVLVYYSNYGQSTDIASPTHFKSFKLNNGYYSSFGGTSAATPVASAVASLIYSINPDLTPADVKNILVSSATEYITKRQVSPYSSSTETLAHPIPMLNAKEALKMAYETVHGNSGDEDDSNDGTNDTTVNFVGEISDYYTPKAKLRYFSYNKDYKVTAISSVVKSSTTQGSYSNYTTATSNSDEVEINLDNSKRYHEITSTLTLQNIFTQETMTTTSVREFTYSDLTIRTIDFSTGNIVPYADFNVSYSTIFKNYSFFGTTDNQGLEKFYLPYGFFKLTGKKEGFSDAKQTVVTKEAKSYSIDLPFGSLLGGEKGAISGSVLDENGAAVSGAIVSIYDNTKLIKTTTTDTNGNYELWNISKTDSSDNLITNFKLTAEKTGYGTVMKQKVIVLNAVNRTENFTLISEPDNQFPLAVAGEDQTVVYGDNVIIGADGSMDYDGYIKTYKWVDDYDNSTLSNKHTFVKTNLAVGTHNILLTVTDNDGAVSSDQVTIIVEALPTYTWIASDWGECEGECETTGTQTRVVECKSSTGATVDDGFCSANPKPDTTQSCQTASCPFEFEEITSPVTGRIWIDRNLGAKTVCTKSRDEFNSDEEYIASQNDCFGDFYQWGRLKDGHQKVDSNITSLISNSINVNHDKLIMTKIEYNFDWTTVDETGSLRIDRWSNINGEGICPTGYRVPTIEELEAENIKNRAQAYNNLKLPVGGFRFIDGGDYGTVWSSSVKLIDDAYVNFYHKFSDDDFAYGVANRIAAMSVRCIKEKAEVLNQPPVANAGADKTVVSGNSVTLDGSLSTDPDGQIVSYEWKEGSSIYSSQESFSINTLSEGLHAIVLTVTDDLGATDTDTVLVNVTPAQGDITYSWATSTWSSCTGVCGENNGIQTRTVVCKSSTGNSAADNLCTDTKPNSMQSCTASLCEIENKPPVANAGSNKEAYLGDTISFDGSNSYDTDGTIASYSWKKGSEELSTSSSFTTNSLTVGTHTITLTVIDNEGATDTDIVLVNILETPTYNWQLGSWSSCIGECGENNGIQTRDAICKNSLGVTVNDSYCESSSKPNSETQSCTASLCEEENNAPIANAGENITIQFGDIVLLNGSNSIDNDGYITNYEWSKDSSVISNSKAFVLAGLSIGTHDIILTVTDNDGATDSDQITITVNAPIADQYYWSIGAWGACEGECGNNNGTQTRTVVCNDSTSTLVDDSMCSGTKPLETQSCTASLCDIEDNETIVSSVTGRVWMDRNLGATRECLTMYDTECFGDYYQWGRDADGHEKITSINSNQIITSLENTHGEFVVSNDLYDYDWINLDNDGEIRSEKWSTSDASAVCPSGFRLPTQSELVAEGINSASDAFNNLKLPLSGDRSYLDGNIYGQTYYGGVWSSETSGKNSMFLFYSSNYVEWLYHSRATGRPVRCIKDQ